MKKVVLFALFVLFSVNCFSQNDGNFVKAKHSIDSLVENNQGILNSNYFRKETKNIFNRNNITEEQYNSFYSVEDATSNKNSYSQHSIDWGLFGGDAAAGFYIQSLYFHFDLGINYGTSKLSNVRPDYYGSTYTPSYGSDTKTNVIIGIGTQLKIWRFSFISGLDNLIKISTYKVWGTAIKSKSTYEAHYFLGFQIEFNSFEVGAIYGDSRGIGAMIGFRIQ